MRSTLLAALLGALLFGFACGGNGGDDQAAAIIHRLLVAAGTDQSGALESFPGRLPEGLPVEPPQYPGAELVVSARQPAPVSTDPDDPEAQIVQPLLYFIVLDTADSRQDVYSFYQQTLDQAPWQLESSFSTSQLDTFQFFDARDADIAGAVSIAAGGGDGHTSILISLQDAGAFLDEPPPYELTESLAIPSGFPPEIPLYAESTVTGSAFFREPGNRSYLLIFLTQDPGDDVLAFYTEAFQGMGWTVTANEPSSLEQRIEFHDDGRAVQGEVFTTAFALSRRYTEVHVRVLLNPAGAPAATPATATSPTETPAP